MGRRKLTLITDFSLPLKNPLHEAFSLEVSKGQKPWKCYQKIYNQERRVLASVAALRLMRRYDILGRIEYLETLNANTGIWSRELAMNTLLSIVNDYNARTIDKIKAINELNTMCGFNFRSGGNTINNRNTIQNKGVMFLAPDGTDKPSEYLGDGKPQNDKMVLQPSQNEPVNVTPVKTASREEVAAIVRDCTGGESGELDDLKEEN